MSRRFSNASRDPYERTLLYDAVCAETGVKLLKGSKAIYYPATKQIYSLNSKQASEYYAWRNDIDMGHDY